MATVITISSGKGGVGKTSCSTNIGIALSSKGQRVCLFDADTGLANVNVLLGLKPTATLEHLLAGEKTIEEITLEAQRGLKVIPAASGIAECADLASDQRARLIDSLKKIENDFDYILIDTAAGIGKNVLDFITAANYSILVITPEPTSLTDAFSMVKALKKQNYDRPVYALVNMAKDYENSIDVFNRFQAAVEKYLKTDVYYLGYVALDENVISSVSFQFPAIIMQSDAPASRCYQKLADVIEKQFLNNGTSGHFSEFWESQVPVDLPDRVPSEPETESTVHSPTPEPVMPASPRTETLADSALRLINEAETSQESAKAFVEPLNKVYFERFQSYPINPYQALYQQLEAGNFPESDIRELVNTLESLFETHFHKPLRNPDSTIIKLLADANGSEEKLTYLNQQLRSSFKRQFNKQLNDPVEEMCSWISDINFSEENFKEAQTTFEKAFENRFGEPYKGEKELLIEQLRAQISELNAERKTLNESFNELTEALDKTGQAQEKLAQFFESKSNTETDS